MFYCEASVFVRTGSLSGQSMCGEMRLQLDVCCALLAVVKVSVEYIYSTEPGARQGNTAGSWLGFRLPGLKV